METIKWPFRAIFKIWFALFFAISLLLLYPLFRYFLADRARFKYAFKLKRFWAWLLQLSAGIVLVRRLKSPLPKGPYIICSNHSSYMDIILMYRVFSEYFVFMGKKEISSWPLFKIFFTKKMNITVDRKSLKGAHQAFVDAGHEIDAGNSVMIFPEGTIPMNAPKMKKFKSGAFRLAIEKGIPIVPVTFVGNWKIMKGSKLLKGEAGPGVSKVYIHPYIDTSSMTVEDTERLSQRVFNTIQWPLESRR